MRTCLLAAVAGFAARQVAGHATWQDLWVDGVDKISLRLPRRHYDISANILERVYLCTSAVSQFWKENMSFLRTPEE